MNGASTLIKAFISIPGGGTAVYTPSYSLGPDYYRHADWLGSSRLASTYGRGLYSSTAYAPFGEQYASSGTADASFTGQNSDTVSSLYDFTFRRLSPSQGRWISPDPAGLAAVDPTNPQTWNRYAYAVNNPLTLVDPQGLCSHDEANEENGEGAGSSGEANPDSYCVEIDEGIPGYEGGGDNIGPCPNNPQDFCLETADGQEIDLGPRLYEIPGVGFNDCDQQCQLELTYDTWWKTNAMGPVPAPKNNSEPVTQDAHYISVLDSNYKSKKCKQAKVMFWAGGMGGSALTTGAAAGAIFTGPEEFVGAEAGFEGVMNLLHIAPIGVPGFGMLVYGFVGMYQNCY